MDLLEVLQGRHSVRDYTGEPIGEEKLTKILQAGLLSASGRAIRPWELIVVRERATLEKLSEGRVGSAKMLRSAGAAVVVVADAARSDTWIEDCSIVLANMHLMAASLGVGSCWIQGRLREARDGRTTEAYVRECLDIPEGFRLEAILSLGVPKGSGVRTELSDLHSEKIHYEKF